MGEGNKSKPLTFLRGLAWSVVSFIVLVGWLIFIGHQDDQKRSGASAPKVTESGALKISTGSQAPANMTPPDNYDLIKFSRVNAEKFKSEILAVNNKSIGSTFVVTVRHALIFGDYDEKRSEMVIRPGDYYAEMIYESCKATGEYQGQSAMGVKATVTKEACERFFIDQNGFHGAHIGGKRVPMTPTQFREIKNHGVHIELDFRINPLGKDTAVTYSDGFNKPTISDPAERTLKMYTVHGDVVGFRIELPGTKQMVTLIRSPKT